jgi:hypothetical protein
MVGAMNAYYFNWLLLFFSSWTDKRRECTHGAIYIYGLNLVQVHTLFMLLLNANLFFLIYEYHMNRKINASHSNDSFKSF